MEQDNGLTEASRQAAGKLLDEKIQATRRTLRCPGCNSHYALELVETSEVDTLHHIDGLDRNGELILTDPGEADRRVKQEKVRCVACGQEWRSVRDFLRKATGPDQALRARSAAQTARPPQGEKRRTSQ